MRSADGDEDAGFADLETAEAVHDGDAVDGKFIVKLDANFAHLGEGHGLVSLVVEIKGRAIVGLVADEAIKGNDGAVFRGAHVSRECGHIDGGANKFENVVVVMRHEHGTRLTAADGREEGDFVAGVKRRVPRCELLIAGGDHGGAIFGELGNARRVEGEELLDGGSIGDFDRFLGMADDILQAAEEEDLNAQDLRDSGHKQIVSRAECCSQPEGKKVRWMEPPSKLENLNCGLAARGWTESFLFSARKKLSNDSMA